MGNTFRLPACNLTHPCPPRQVPKFHFIVINAVRDIKTSRQFYSYLWDRVLEIEEKPPEGLGPSKVSAAVPAPSSNAQAETPLPFPSPPLLS